MEPSPESDDRPDVELGAYQHLVDHADVMLFIIDGDGHYRLINRKFETLSGYSKRELIGQGPDLLLDDEGLDHVSERLVEVLETNGARSSACTTSMHCKDGGEIPISIHFTILPLEDGEYQGMVGVARDIRTARHRKQKLDVLGRVLRHDVRNKINVIQGTAEVVRRGVQREKLSTEEIETFTQKIEENANSMLDLTEKSRTIQSKLRVDHVGEESTDLYDRAVDAAKGFYEANGDVADIELVGSPDTTIQSPDEVHLIIHELIENAVEHADEPEPAVKVEIREEGDERGVLRIHDECPPFPEEHLETLDAIEQSQLDHQNGLGLWLVNWYTTTVNADYEVERTSDLGGNTSTIRFPTPGHSP